MSENPVKVLVVGAGPMGRHHADAVIRLGPAIAVLEGFVDPDPDTGANAASARGTRAFVDLGAALEEVRPDVVHVCTPPALHAAVARQSLHAGAHVYVEKPFTLSTEEAVELLELGEKLGLKLAAGHQLLRDPATKLGGQYFASIGDLRHVESYFAFRPRREASGRPGRTPLEQLLDIIPHPSYLLAHFLEKGTGVAPKVIHLGATEEGRANALVEAGDATGSLTVTLEGRPVDSFVRLIGTRGTVHLDYVRGIAVPRLWPGSGLDKVVEPFHQAWKVSWGSSVSLVRRVLRKERSYPGLAQMFDDFYQAIREGADSPVTAANILFTVDLVERVQSTVSSAPYQAPSSAPTVAVTGGQGFLGREVVRSLLMAGEVPLVLSRRMPLASQRVEGVHYQDCDLSERSSVVIPPTVKSVVHCAAETAGSWDAHQRNSIDATRNLLDAAESANVSRFIHVSSLGVVSLKARQPVDEDAPVEADSRARGPYVWGKLESERLVTEMGRSSSRMALHVVRPGPLMDPEDGPTPGRLGRPAGPLLVAIGPPWGKVPTTNVAVAGHLLAEAAAGTRELPELLHLLDPEPYARRDLVRMEKRRRKGTRVLWIPWTLVRVASLLAVSAQKLLRPRARAINIAGAFAAPRYDTSRISEVLAGR